MDKQNGFTILELMVIVAISAALLVIGLPNFQQMMTNNRITSQLNLMASSLALARSEAAKLNRRVTICPSTNGTACDVTQDFTAGWVVFVDRTTSTPPVIDASGGDPCAATSVTDCVLNYVNGLNGPDITLRSTATGNFVTFNGLGAPITGAATFSICNEEDVASVKAIILSNTGRASVRTPKEEPSLTCLTPPP